MALLRGAEQDAALIGQDGGDPPHRYEVHAVAVADDEDQRARRLPGERDTDDDADVAVRFDAVAERLRELG
jgi:hypothetical protein